MAACDSRLSRNARMAVVVAFLIALSLVALRNAVVYS